MNIAFSLSMPGVNSWNGKWSGEGRDYTIIRSFGTSKASKEKAESILKRGYFSYSFGDGWRAAVSVRKVEPYQAKKLRKTSAGFCGYDWMVDSIISHGEIKV